MHKLIFSAVAVATLALSAPAFAQVRIDAGAPGVGVHVGGRYHNDREHRGHRAQARCREVTTRTVRPNGNVVIRKSQRCR